MLIMLFRSLFFAIFLVFCSFTYAEEEPNIKQPLIFSVGVENTNKLPLYAVNERGEFVGLYRKILDAFAKDNNIKFVYKPYKINELFYNLINAKIDFKFPDNPTWRATDKRNYNIVYSDPVYFYVEALFVKPSNLKKTIDQFSSIGLVGDVALWSIHNYIEVNRIKIKRNQCKKLIKQLFASEIEGILCNYFVMKNALAELGLEDRLVPNFYLPNVDDYIYLSSVNHPDIIQNFNIWLKTHSNDIHQCHLRYYHSASKQNECIF
jgi:polar amino acid transport system substrate-binding protein